MPCHFLNQYWSRCLKPYGISRPQWVNTLRPRQNGRRFPDDIFKWIFLNENVWISINISLKFVPMGLINNIPALVQIMAWRRQGDKPLSEPRMESLLTHICVTRPQWVKPDLSNHEFRLHMGAQMINIQGLRSSYHAYGILHTPTPLYCYGKWKPMKPYHGQPKLTFCMQNN